MRFSITSLLQHLRRFREPPAAGPESTPIQRREVDQAAEDRRNVTEQERVAAAQAAREVMEQIRRERPGGDETKPL
ncbi:hypothetical protein FHS01_003567 [Longimicrobium terrae]|uniref:Uncharacterized protein n=1 Tax=Longimicrobium terrae TaxID=1639882 RepID=A0A841H1L3_9BACT|nr:hypothetical protein [Longimicrobium terrae]MBB6071907.1 hypothetical protein [Longimicrobium terrae]